MAAPESLYLIHNINSYCPPCTPPGCPSSRTMLVHSMMCCHAAVRYFVNGAAGTHASHNAAPCGAFKLGVGCSEDSHAKLSCARLHVVGVAQHVVKAHHTCSHLPRHRHDHHHSLKPSLLLAWQHSLWMLCSGGQHEWMHQHSKQCHSGNVEAKQSIDHMLVLSTRNAV